MERLEPGQPLLDAEAAELLSVPVRFVYVLAGSVAT